MRFNKDERIYLLEHGFMINSEPSGDIASNLENFITIERRSEIYTFKISLGSISEECKTFKKAKIIAEKLLKTA